MSRFFPLAMVAMLASVAYGPAAILALCVGVGYVIGRPIGRAVQTMLDNRAEYRAILARDMVAFDRAYFTGLYHRGVITRAHAERMIRHGGGI